MMGGRGGIEELQHHTVTQAGVDQKPGLVTTHRAGAGEGGSVETFNKKCHNPGQRIVLCKKKIFSVENIMISAFTYLLLYRVLSTVYK